MKNRVKKSLSLLLAVIMLLCAVPLAGVSDFDFSGFADCFSIKAQAATSGNLSYEVSKGKATITKCKTTISGKLDIPSTLGGYPVTSIGSYSFVYCTGLTSITIPDSVTSIGEVAFKGCTGLTSITIPDSVTSIGYRAFYGCTGLTSLTVDSENKVYHSKNNCIINTEKKELVVGCKNSVIPSDGSVTSIGECAFVECKGLKSLTIPKGVTSIGEGSFAICKNLTNVTIPNSVTSIGESAFDCCTSLTSITIPNSVTSIGIFAFNYCTGLKSVKIGKNVTSIGYGAFGGCKSLTSITIPNSVTSIGYGAFGGCKSLTSITIPDGVTILSDFLISGCTGLKSITLPKNLTIIGYGSFHGCTGLKNITIPNSVTIIGGQAFYQCTGLTSIKIPGKVTDIGPYAFEGCTSLKSVTIPNSVTSIEDLAFENTALKTITLPKSVKKIGEKAIGYKGNKTVSGFVIKGYPGTVAEKYAKDNGFKFVSLDEHTHAFNKGVVTKKATCASRGVKTFTCTACKATKTQKIAKIATVKLSKKNFAYTGKAIKPKVIIKDANGKQLQLGSDYTVKYKANKSIGKATVIVTFKGNYAGTKKLTFNIVPTAPTVKASAGKKTATLKFSGSSGADKYTIYYSTSKNSGYKKIAVTAKNTYKVKNLTSGKAYFFKAVASKTVGKNTFNSSFSSPKKAVIK